jgi:hypothetical protein
MSSLVTTGNAVYFSNTLGVTTVLARARVFTKLAENCLEDRCFASPAIGGGRLYIRTATQLYCIAD